MVLTTVMPPVQRNKPSERLHETILETIEVLGFFLGNMRSPPTRSQDILR